LNKDVEALCKIRQSDRVQFYSCATIEREDTEYLDVFPNSMLHNIVETLPVPHTLADGQYLCDGSVIAGGRKGACLDGLRDSIEEVFCSLRKKRKHRDISNAHLRQLARQKALNDVEIIETVMEHNLDYWVTCDYKMIRRCVNFAKNRNDCYQEAVRMSIRPTALVEILGL